MNDIMRQMIEDLMPPGFVREHRFHPVRRWRFDYAWPQHKVALEIEGAAFMRGRHTRGAGFRNDIAKYNAATLLGWRVFRCLPEEFQSAEVTRFMREAFLALRLPVDEAAARSL